MQETERDREVREKERETDRQTDRQTNRQTDRQTERNMGICFNDRGRDTVQNIKKKIMEG